jgi:hypothetical protein
MAQSLEFGIVGKSNASEVMGKAGKEADKLAKKLKEAFDIKDALTNAFISAFGAAALLDKSIQLITDSFKEMGSVGDQAAKAGISPQEFEKLAYVAKSAEVDMRNLSKAVRELRFYLKDAQTDTTKMSNLTKGLGFTEEEVRSGNIKAIDVYARLAFAMNQAQTDVEKLNVVSSFFSNTVATNMIPVLETIAKNPAIFDGLLTGSDEAYAKMDAMNDKFDKMYHNAKRLIGLGIFNTIQENQEVVAKSGFLSGVLRMFSPSAELASKGLAAFTSMGEGTTGQAQAALNAKVNAKEIKNQNQPKDSNTIANSLGASMGNGPTSGVIGVGNNATFSLMEEQLDALKDIKDAIDRLGPISPMNTDFTKPEYPTV